MNRTKNPVPYRQISVPHADMYLAGSKPYVPPKAYDPRKIRARQESKARGSLVASHQNDGILVLRTITTPLDRLRDERARDLLAGGALYSALESLRGNATTRSNFWIPDKADTSGRRETVDEAWDKLQTKMLLTQRWAEKVLDATVKRDERLPSIKAKFGHEVGEAALQLACVEMDVTSIDSAFEVQNLVRDRSSTMIANARVVAHEMNDTPPTLAQLVEDHSPFVLYIHQTSPADLPARHASSLAGIQARRATA